MDLRAHASERIFLQLCSKIEVGCLRITTPVGRSLTFGSPSAPTRAELRILDPSLYYEVLTQGDWGLGWGFVFRKWESEEPYRVALIFMLNEHVFRPYVVRAGRLSPTWRRIRSSNVADQSPQEAVRRRTISECYDVGNDFFYWMLGPSMVYTCAIWPDPAATLEEAQENKLRLVTQKARIEPHHAVLDLGCGWGTLCDYIRKHTGARVKGLTLAREQVEWAQEHYGECEFEYQNYDDVTGLYDRIVCVGMAEHVGRPNLQAFFQLVADHLKPGGRFVLHSMTAYDGLLMQSHEDRWTSFASVAMPNGDVPSMSNFIKAAMQTGTLRPVHTETFGVHYARTAMAWRDNVMRNRDRIVAAYSEELYRTYLYSWSMGAAAFETGITLAHFVFEKQAYGSSHRNAML